MAAAAQAAEPGDIASTHPRERAAAALLAPHRPGLGGTARRQFMRGLALFDAQAQAGPARGNSHGGLGPTFNLKGCADCHAADGRGRPPLALGEPLHQMVIRLSVRGADGMVAPHPAYGMQLNDKAVDDAPAEGRAFVEYRAIEGTYGDGMPYELAAPAYGFFGMAFGRLDDDVLISPRVPSQAAGTGLLDAVPEAAILALADEADADGDGVSGRPNLVAEVASGEMRLGRLGWKANQPSLRQQIAHAARIDIGLTSSLYPAEDCPPVQTACRAAASRGEPELSDAALDALETYLKGLDPPLRRDMGAAAVIEGERLFAAFGCTACHVPELPVDAARLPGSAPARIAAYTDLLLHDMGERLADGRPDFLASGPEWRTAPLWGVGLVEALNGHTRFLHDGRARGLAEAILWHGGEAEAAKESFRTAPAAERAALIAFLNSL
ncbi:MAG: di-heme oxidoredictase family protein [Alphaproteobacteria bacterium]